MRTAKEYIDLISAHADELRSQLSAMEFTSSDDRPRLIEKVYRLFLR